VEGAHHFVLSTATNPQKIHHLFRNFRASILNVPNDEIPTFGLVLRDNHRSPVTNLYTGETMSFFGAQRVNRLEQLREMRDRYFPAGHSGNPSVACGVGVCVQMIEAWLLLAANPDEHDENLPLFGECTGTETRKYYGALATPVMPKDIPPQLKDRFLDFCRENGISPVSFEGRTRLAVELAQRLADNSRLSNLERRSVSFRMFCDDLREYIPPPPHTDESRA
jgi:hypothetical protein